MTPHDEKVKAALQQHGAVLQELLARVAALEQGKRPPGANGQPKEEQATALGSDEQEGVEDGY